MFEKRGPNRSGNGLDKIGRDEAEIQELLHYRETQDQEGVLKPKQFEEPSEMNSPTDWFLQLRNNLIIYKKWITVGLFVVILFVVIGFVWAGRSSSGKAELRSPADVLIPFNQVTTTTTANKKMAHIVGAVVAEGVYEIDSSTRVIDLIKLAGGVAVGGDPNALNLAVWVGDGQKVCVPFRENDREKGNGCEAHQYFIQSVQNQPINLNTASSAQLESLRGIGASRAQEIILYRRTNGDLQDIEELTNIEGITSNVIDGFRDRVIVR